MVAYSFQKRFVQPIEIGLKHAHHILDGVPGLVQPKRQTIRPVGKRRHARPGETLQLYLAMRTKHCRKIGEARCIGVYPILIVFDDLGVGISISGVPLMPSDMPDFAKADGFDGLDDMREFWRAEHKGVDKFAGYLIQWEPIHV